jgi:hypothetical protein
MRHNAGCVKYGAPFRAGQFQPVLDILADLEARERLEMITHRDALAQLAQARAVQAVAQLRLAQQDDLQQLAVVGLDVGEQADLFEQVLGQILRLVNDEHGFLALLDLFQQKFADGRDGVQRSRPFTSGRIPSRWPSSIHPRSAPDSK